VSLWAQLLAGSRSLLRPAARANRRLLAVDLRQTRGGGGEEDVAVEAQSGQEDEGKQDGEHDGAAPGRHSGGGEEEAVRSQEQSRDGDHHQIAREPQGGDRREGEHGDRHEAREEERLPGAVEQAQAEAGHREEQHGQREIGREPEKAGRLAWSRVVGLAIIHAQPTVAVVAGAVVGPGEAAAATPIAVAAMTRRFSVQERRAGRARKTRSVAFESTARTRARERKRVKRRSGSFVKAKGKGERGGERRVADR
jgi:hypothetical protein